MSAVWFLLCLAMAEPVVLPGTAAEVVFEDDVTAAVEAAIADLASGRFDAAARQLGALADAGGGGDLRYLQVVALFEAGELRPAESAAVRGLEETVGHAGLLCIYGVVLSDLGRGEEALGVLSRAAEAAARIPDAELQARSWLNTGVVQADWGAREQAREAFQRAVEIGRAAGRADVMAEARRQLEALEASGGSDLVGRVSDELRRGRLEAARVAAEAGAGGTRRQRARASIATGMVQRALGRLSEAAESLSEAVREADGGGLLREAVAARLELARVLHLGGRDDAAEGVLGEAWARVSSSSLRVRALDVALSRARLAAAREDGAGAAAAREDAYAVSVGIQHPDKPAQLAEVDAEVAELGRRLDEASLAWQKAGAHWSARGLWADAARVATRQVSLDVARGEAPRGGRQRALEAFTQAGDRLGPAHVAMAEGLGHVQRGGLDAALAAFARAAIAAGAEQGPRGAQLSGLAESNAAEVLILLGHDPSGVASSPLSSMVQRHERFLEARRTYEQGRRAFEGRRFVQAVASFETSLDGFRGLGEGGHATAALRSLAWSRWNMAASAAPEQAAVLFDKVLEEAREVADSELVVRATGGAVIAHARLGAAGVVPRLREAADAAEQAGLDALAARCQAELAEQAMSLDERAAAARAAWSLTSDDVGAYALYSVAVDALRADRPDLAGRLAAEIAAFEWGLSAEVAQVVEAAAL